MSISNLSLRPSAVNRRTLYLLICVFVALSGLWTIWEPLGRDQSIHASIAFALREGQSTYSDVYNIKPPMTTAAHYLSQVVFGHSTMSIRIFDMFAVALAGVGLMRLLLMLGHGVAASFVAPLGFVTIYYTLSFWERAQTDGWAAFLCVLALLCLVHGWQSGRNVAFAAAGFSLGIAFAFKYTIAGLGLVVFAPLLVRTGEVRFRIADFLTFVGGGLIALVAIALVLMSAGTLGDFFEIQSYILSYVSGWRRSAFVMIERVAILVSANPPLAALVVLGLMITLARLVFVRRHLAPVIISIWVATAFLSIWVQGKGFAYQALPMLVALSAAVAPAIDLIWQLLRRHLPNRFAVLILAALVVITLVMPTQLSNSAQAVFQLAQGRRPSIPQSDWERVDFSTRENQEAADFLKRILGPEETFFLWGYETTLYFLTERAPQHRYPYSWPFVVDFYDGRYSDDLIARLNAQPPDFFVVQRGDATPWVTGRERDSAEMLGQFAELRDFLTNGYHPLASLARFDVWEKNTDE